MGIEENKAMVHRYYELFNQQELDAYVEVIADIAFPENFTREQNKQLDIMWFKAFPDLKATVLDIVAEGDKVSFIRVLSGTHTGEPFMGIPATGKKIETKAALFWRIADNKIVEGSIVSDPGPLQSLGVIPTWEEAMKSYKETHNLE